MKMTSTVKWFDAKKGYGFINHPDGEADIFVHYTSIESDHRFRTLHTDEPVAFELVDGPKGIHAQSVVSTDPDFRPADEAAEQAPRFQPPDPEAALAREVSLAPDLEQQSAASPLASQP